jgi:hypothetical protein
LYKIVEINITFAKKIKITVMKKIITLCLVFISVLGYAQVKLTFEYDAAGNQIVRKICANCTVSRNANETAKEFSKLKEKDLEKFFPQDVISYYPNPVKEELYLKWDIINNNKVSEIQVYTITGQLVRSYAKLDNQNNFVMAFQSYPEGIYTLLLLYTDGDQKSIKIIKQ